MKPWILSRARFFVDILFSIGCGFLADWLAGIEAFAPAFPIIRGGGVVFLWAAAIYFWQHGIRLGYKMKKEKVARMEAEDAPISLGLSGIQAGVNGQDEKQ
jgi:hypothetical protein